MRYSGSSMHGKGYQAHRVPIRGVMNDAPLSELRITDAYTCVWRAEVSTTTEKPLPLVIIGKMDWMDVWRSVPAATRRCDRATLRPGTRCNPRTRFAS